MNKKDIYILSELDQILKSLEYPWYDMALYIVDQYDTKGTVDEYHMGIAEDIIMLKLGGRI